MPTGEAEPVLRMLAAVGFVAAAAVPVGLGCWRLGRRSAPPPLPAPTADDPVVALGYLMLFVGFQVGAAVLGQTAGATGLPQQFAASDEASVVGVWRSVFGSLLMLPVVLAGWVGFRIACRSVGSWRAAARAMAVGVGGWLAVSPWVYGMNAVAEWASALAGVVPQAHPLVKVATAADAGRAAVLFAAVAVATPFAEEVVFRGALLGWLVRRPGWAVVPVGLAAVVALGVTDGRVRLMAAGFLLALAVGLMIVRHRPQLTAVWATATLFAAVHAGVWPTPVPLFLLGLALGWVTVRTGGVLAGTVLHGLFNAVSLVYLVRG